MTVDRTTYESQGSTGGRRPVNRWQDWVSLILGGWLFIAPWIWHGTTATTASATVSGWNAWILGVVIAVMALWALSSPDASFPEWINVIAGLWLFIAPWVLGFAAVAHSSAWNQWIVGIAVFLLSLGAMSSRSTGSHIGHAGTA